VRKSGAYACRDFEKFRLRTSTTLLGTLKNRLPRAGIGLLPLLPIGISASPNTGGNAPSPANVLHLCGVAGGSLSLAAFCVRVSCIHRYLHSGGLFSLGGQERRQEKRECVFLKMSERTGSPPPVLKAKKNR
jgi:hypothetical protein